MKHIILLIRKWEKFFGIYMCSSTANSARNSNLYVTEICVRNFGYFFVKLNKTEIFINFFRHRRRKEILTFHF